MHCSQSEKTVVLLSISRMSGYTNSTSSIAQIVMMTKQNTKDQSNASPALQASRSSKDTNILKAKRMWHGIAKKWTKTLVMPTKTLLKVSKSKNCFHVLLKSSE